MFLPHKMTKVFLVYRSASITTTGGRAMRNAKEEVGSFHGILAQASATEKERWKQVAHPVDHKVIVKGTAPDVRVGDVISTAGREMIVSAIPYDVGGIAHYTIIYCKERNDLN